MFLKKIQTNFQGHCSLSETFKDFSMLLQLLLLDTLLSELLSFLVGRDNEIEQVSFISQNEDFLGFFPAKIDIYF